MSRGGHTTKLHVVGGLGNPLYFQLSSGKIHDSTMAVDVLSYLNISNSNVLADKAYGTDEIREYLTSEEATYKISPKSNARNSWKYD